MTTEEIRAKLATMIAEKVTSRITSQQIQWDTRLRDDLGIDSLAVAELMYDIEETFGTPLDEIEPAKLVTLRDAVAAIERGLQLPPAN
jgi:acyl carrier protein